MILSKSTRLETNLGKEKLIAEWMYQTDRLNIFLIDEHGNIHGQSINRAMAKQLMNFIQTEVK